MKIAILVFSITLFFQLNAREISLIGPYIGMINNHQKPSTNKKESEETGRVYGIYGRYINDQLFCINNSFYYIPTVNKYEVIREEFNGDFYPYHFSFGSLAIGGGVEYTSNSQNTSSAEISQTSIAPFLRIGQNINFGDESTLRIFPWLGYGKKYFKEEGSATTDETKNEWEIDSDDSLLLSGCSIIYYYKQYLSIEFNYLLTRNLKEQHNNYKITSMLNTYLHNHFGVSYRFLYNENSTEENFYHMIGVFYIF